MREGTQEEFLIWNGLSEDFAPQKKQQAQTSANVTISGLPEGVKEVCLSPADAVPQKGYGGTYGRDLMVEKK